ncbi:MAG: hypothetical protein PHO23_01150 [Candidatus Pacebacteria bacterium]|nr:hypothetical protein [Candidatus Paceibacterota bacterium]
MYNIIKIYLLYPEFYSYNLLIINYLECLWRENICLSETHRTDKPLKYFLDDIFFPQIIEKLDLSKEEKIKLFTKPFLELSDPTDLLNQIFELEPLYSFIEYIDRKAIQKYFEKKK